MRRSRIGLAVAAVVLTGAASGGALTPDAHAQARAACWHRVLDDWSAGSLGHGYPIACYRAAIAHLPDDVRIYSSAEHDIRLAMLAAIPIQTREPAPTPALRREPAVRAAGPVAPKREAAPQRRVASASGRARPVSAERGVDGEGHSLPVPLAVLIPGILVLWLAAACAFVPVRRAYQARRGR